MVNASACAYFCYVMLVHAIQKRLRKLIRMQCHTCVVKVSESHRQSKIITTHPAEHNVQNTHNDLVITIIIIRIIWLLLTLLPLLSGFSFDVVVAVVVAALVVLTVFAIVV